MGKIMKDAEISRKKRGRPKQKIGGIDTRLELRISSEERAALEHMLVESDRSKSELVRRAIMTYYRANYGRW